MTTYPLSAYGSNPNAGKSPNGASGRGWGSGWPNCQTTKMVKVVSDAGHYVLVRREIGTLVATLFKIGLKLGFDPNPTDLLQTWGFACRAIANTRTPSNHSWGLAVDQRATENPYSLTFTCTIPPAVVHAWEVCGFYWGGRYSKKKDTMHFEFIGTPAQVDAYTAKALKMLADLNRPSGGGSATEPPKGSTKGTVLTMSRIQNMAKGFAMKDGDPAYDEVTAFLDWCERLTRAGGPAILNGADGTETWQRAIRQKAYGAAGTYLTAVIRNFQERYKLEVDGIFGPKTAAIAAHDGFIIH